jgi:two-component system OmpR family response regulator
VLDSARVDLVILDVMLPGEDGFVLCRNLRARGNWPVIMLTAKGEDTERIVGPRARRGRLHAQAVQPARAAGAIKSVLRAPSHGARQSAARSDQALHSPAGTLDLASRNLVSRDQVVGALSGAEFRLLRVFLAYPNRVLSRDQLMDLTVGREADPLDRSVDVQVSRLRQRLGDDAREARHHQDGTRRRLCPRGWRRSRLASDDAACRVRCPAGSC